MQPRITVEIVEDYGDCGYTDNGCSGWESVEVIATDGIRRESSKRVGCFGVSVRECFEEVINNWVAAAQMKPLVEAARELCHQMREAIMLINDAPAITGGMESALERTRQALATVDEMIKKEK